MGDATRDGMPGRLLRLLSLLQTRREWSGADLADRLGVTPRTVRRDVERLRALDYPILGTTGTAGGYRLTAGANLPPLLLDDEEAVAVAVGLATAAGASVTGIDESAMRALMKLERLLPARLRPRLAAVSAATAAVPHWDARPVDAAVLARLAGCCRDAETLTLDYEHRDGSSSSRRVEPHHLVTAQGRWYLVAWDIERDSWRTLRVDRIHAAGSAGRSFEARQLPAADAASFLLQSFAAASYRHHATVTVALSAQAVRDGVFASIPGDVTVLGPELCVVRLSADSPQLVTQFVAALAALAPLVAFDGDDEVRRHVRELRNRLARDKPGGR